MIKFISHPNIDKTKWDDCIIDSGESCIYALSWYLDIVYKKWDAIVDEEDKVYVTVMPLPYKKKWGLKYVYQSWHTHQLGIISTIPTISFVYFQKFFNFFLSKTNYIATYDFNISNTTFFKEDQFYIKAYTYNLNLNKPYNDLYKDYKKGLKGDIKKAKKNDLQIQFSIDIEPLLILFKENTASKINIEISANDYNIMRQLIQVALNKGLGKIYYIFHNNAICAGAFFYIFHNKIIYQFASSNETGRYYNGISFILNHVIENNAETSKTLEFEGGMVPTLGKFFKGFGAYPQYYNILYYNKFKFLTNLFKIIQINFLKKMFKKSSL
ncbi:hypothetical protein [Adhaeribacter aquaticus]|uniref:hypothetical protein n=1 Tax=Adhaeribacter aquaticus TaxID=299567 RepID=UPI00042A2B02|nr:hypothetical protein [Adhaeribacter aquaticus]